MLTQIHTYCLGTFCVRFINSPLFPLINIILLFPVPYACPRELEALSVFPLWMWIGLTLTKPPAVQPA